MLKVVENCRPAVSARVLLICSLAIGFASTARADEYQYTITFDPSESVRVVDECHVFGRNVAWWSGNN